jgi:hypothetical protein
LIEKSIQATFYKHGGRMQQWEYQTASLSPVIGFGKYKGWRLKAMNEQDLPDWKHTEKHVSVIHFI